MRPRIPGACSDVAEGMWAPDKDVCPVFGSAREDQYQQYHHESMSFGELHITVMDGGHRLVRG